MPKKRFSAKQIVTLLRQIEVLMAQGKSACVYRKPKPGCSGGEVRQGPCVN
jgi:hypothetical protein